jgi:hypothetical protein
LDNRELEFAAVADFEIDDVPIGPVHELVGNALRRKARAHAGRQRDFLPVRDQGRFAFQDVNEFVLLAADAKAPTRRRARAASG